MFPRLISFLFALSLSSATFAQIQEVPDSAAVTGVGKIFEIKTSDFLNITVESTNDVFGYVQSILHEITINIAKPEPQIQSTTLTVKNLEPQKSYNLVKNGNSEVMTSDENGSYTFEVDLSLPQKIQIYQHQ
ncbi:MAG TPA: hypothetical protein VHO70_14050 [Chitinispirillaceae bacterium]|nr:hypothetical protein [Chitinispirillaceae bacterium]